MVNGPSSTPLPDSVIVIDGPSIRAAGPRKDVPIPQDSERIDGTGKFVAPAQHGARIAAGEPADLLLFGSYPSGTPERTLTNGRWSRAAGSVPAPAKR